MFIMMTIDNIHYDADADDDLQVKTVLSMYQKHKVSVGSLTGQVLIMMIIIIIMMMITLMKMMLIIVMIITLIIVMILMFIIGLHQVKKI